MEVTIPLSYPTVAVDVSDITQVGEARRAAADLSAKLQFDESTAGGVAIIINELGSNLVKHGNGGQLLLNAIWTTTQPRLDIVAIDKGPGMSDISKCMEDGFSTRGTAGNGLGAVRRIARHFDVVTAPHAGTAVLARVFKGQAAAQQSATIGAVNLPKREESVSGDSWAARANGASHTVIVADGLGHGISAAEASREAIRIFGQETNSSPAATLQAAHSAMRATRGAAVAIAHMNLNSGEVTFCGVGNIVGQIISHDFSTRSMVSHNGIIGHEAKRFTEFTYPCPAGALLVMYSDGLQTQCSLQKYAGIHRRDCSLISAVLYRDFNRGRDDATVVVVKS